MGPESGFREASCGIVREVLRETELSRRRSCLCLSVLVAYIKDSPFTSEHQLVKDDANVCQGCGISLFDPLRAYTVSELPPRRSDQTFCLATSPHDESTNKPCANHLKRVDETFGLRSRRC